MFPPPTTTNFGCTGVTLPATVVAAHADDADPLRVGTPARVRVGTPARVRVGTPGGCAPAPNAVRAWRRGAARGTLDTGRTSPIDRRHQPLGPCRVAP